MLLVRFSSLNGRRPEHVDHDVQHSVLSVGQVEQVGGVIVGVHLVSTGGLHGRVFP